MPHPQSTKLVSSLSLLMLLLAFLVFLPTWQRGLLSFSLVLGGVLALSAFLRWPFVWLVESKNRRPGESLWDLSRRIHCEDQEHAASQKTERSKRPNWYFPYRKYRYLTLDCGHVLHEYFPKELPQTGQKFWCWGHRRFGPAQEQTVLSVKEEPPPDEDAKILY